MNITLSLTVAVLRPFAAALTLAAVLASAGCSRGGDEDLAAAAKLSLEKGDLAAASIQFKSALQVNPNDLASRVGLGRTLLLQGDVEGAVIELNRAADAGAVPDDVVPLQARALVEAGQFKRVVQTLANIKLKDPALQGALLVEVSRAWAALGDVKRTEASINEALTVSPGQPEATLMRARLAAVQGRLDEATRQVDELLAKHAAMPDAWSLRGDLHRVAGRETEAVAAYQKALAAQPTHMASHVALIGLRIRAGDRGAAKQQLEAMEKSAPFHPVTALARAEQALYDGDIPKARELTQALLRTFPDHGGILVLAGTVESALGAVVQASAHFGKALGQDPQMSVAREGLAAAEIRLGQLAKALGTLAPLLGPEGSSPRAFALAGEAQVRLGDHAAAARLFTQAAKLSPKDNRLRTAALSAKMLGQDAVAAMAELRQLADTSGDIHADQVLLSAHLSRREFDQALAVVSQMEKKLPGDASVVELKGRVLAARGDRAGARAAYESALQKDPARFGAMASLVDLDVADGRAEDAEKRLRAEAARAKDNPLPLLLLAELRARSGAPPAEVSGLFDDAVRSNPTYAEARLRQIRYLLQRRQFKDALSQAQSALSALPTDTAILEASGVAQLQSGDTEQSATTFRRLATALPGSPMPYMRLAEVYRAQGKSDQAELALRNALDLAPDDPRVMAALADLLSNGKRRDDAVELARRMRNIRPTQPLGYLLEAELLQRKGDREGALVALRAGFARAPASVVTARLHTLLLQLGRGPEADRLAADWLKKYPEDMLLEYQVAMREASQGQTRPAEARLRRVVAANPGNPMAQNNLASLIMVNGGRDAAQHAQRANDISPGQPQLMDTLAAALALEGRLREAVELQRKAIAADGQDLNLRLGLAKLLLKSGDKSGARAELDALQAAGTSFPRHPEVKELVSQL